ASSNAASGTTHGEMDVANDLPRKGPSGTYSKAWISRADQSLTSTTPNTCSAKDEIGTGVPRDEGTPTTKPTSASMSRRNDGPYSPASPTRRKPHGRTMSVPETTTVPARPW